MKIKRQKEIIIIIVSIFIMSFLWIGFNLWHNSVTSTISQPLNENIKYISPDFNTTIIQALKNRTYVAPQYTIPAQNQETSIPGTTPFPTASVAATLTIPVNASTSGQTKLETP